MLGSSIASQSIGSFQIWTFDSHSYLVIAVDSLLASVVDFLLAITVDCILILNAHASLRLVGHVQFQS